MKIFAAFVFTATLAGTACADAAKDCLADLESIPAFLLANDAGGRDSWDRQGRKHFDEALARARTAVAKIEDPAACTVELRAYLKAWRAGHLGVREMSKADTPAVRQETPPRVEWPSAQTAVLVLPSFGANWRQPIADLLEKNHDELARHPFWIVDVRGNGGGSDDVYAPVMQWIGPPIRVETQVDYFVTAANIDATRRMCPLLMIGDELCEQAMKQERERMQSAPLGDWILQQPGPVLMDVRQEDIKPARPSKVAILVDGNCVSSCEEFLLSARQSFSVKLVGQRSRGALDYSNMRPHELPSGQRMLMYTVTRSHRIPGMPVDGIGVVPDVYIPAEQAEGAALIAAARRWLEGGGLVSPP